MNAGEQNPKIIVSYRRADSAMAGRIFDRLVQRFGKESLFIDIDNIPFGGDFRKHIDDALKTSDLLIALVGPKWLGASKRGTARIMQEADPVRVEIETALRRDIPILPVLIDGAKIPAPDQLPESVRDFAYRNAAEVVSGRDFDVHVDRLIKAIEQILGAKAGTAPAPAPASEKSALVSPPPPAPAKAKRSLAPLILGGGLAALAAIAAAIWFARERVSVADDIDPTTGTAYCADVKQVVEAARGDFTAILGKPDGNANWISRIQLPGWDNCRVSDWTTNGKIIRYFGCELPSIATVDEMHGKRDTAVAYLQSCLGRDWARQRRTFNNGATETNFKLGSDEPIARIRETIYTDTRGNILYFEVDVPSGLIRQAPVEEAAEQPPTEQPPVEEPPAATAEAYCEDLKRVVTASRNNFADILGPVSTKDSWISRVQLPGWNDCRVQDLVTQGKTERYFTCDRGSLPNAEVLPAKREEQDAYVKPCLGPDWSVRRSEFSNGAVHSIYFMGPDDPQVRVREVIYTDPDEWLLRIDVEAPKSLAVPAAPEAAAEDPATPPTDEPPQPSAQADAYCDDLKRAVTEARGNFSAILGETASDGGWTARLQLPGWKECTVQDLTSQGIKSRYFTCLRGPYAELEALRAAREGAEAYVTPCLGSGWSVRRPENPNKTIHTIYSMGTDDPVVTLREAFSEKSKKWWFRIDVDAPASLGIPAPPAPTPDQAQTPPPASDQSATTPSLPKAANDSLQENQLGPEFFNPEPSANPAPKQ